MQMNRREKTIAVVTAALVLLFVGDRLVLEPALAYRSQLVAEAERQSEARELGERLYTGLPALEQRWRQLRSNGLTDSAGDAEARLLQAAREWAGDAGVGVTSMLPDRVDPEGRLPRVYVRVSGTGSMRQVIRLLHAIEAADLPVRVEELQMNTRRDADGDLMVQLRLSTLYLNDQPAPAAIRPGRPRP